LDTDSPSDFDLHHLHPSEMAEEEEDLVDYDDNDLLTDSDRRHEEEQAPTPTSQRSSLPASASSSASKRGGWGQFNTTPTTAQQPRKREKLMFDPPTSARTSFQSDPAEVFSTVLVSKLPPEAKVSKLMMHFESFGPLAEIVVERSLGRAYVRFSNPLSAKNALRAPLFMHQTKMQLHRVREDDSGGSVLGLVGTALLGEWFQ
jgi:hypothetical protein